MGLKELREGSGLKDSNRLIVVILGVVFLLVSALFAVTLLVFMSGGIGALKSPPTTSSTVSTSTTSTASTTTTIITTTTLAASTTTTTSSTTTTTSASTTTLDTRLMEANCISSRITYIYFGGTDREKPRYCSLCKNIEDYYGEYFGIFQPKMRYCIEQEDNQDCLDDMEEYRKQDDLLDARTGKETASVGYPAAVIGDNAYVAITPGNLRSLTVC